MTANEQYDKLMRQDTEIWYHTKRGEWLDALFHDNETGELFLVELQKEEGEVVTDFIAKCMKVALDNFNSPNFMQLIDGNSADIFGYDTY